MILIKMNCILDFKANDYNIFMSVQIYNICGSNKGDIRT